MERIKPTKKELAACISVAIRLMPKKAWRDLERYWELLRVKRQGPRPEIERAIGEAIAEHFEKAGWEVTYPKRENEFADKVDRAF